MPWLTADSSFFGVLTTARLAVRSGMTLLSQVKDTSGTTVNSIGVQQNVTDRFFAKEKSSPLSETTQGVGKTHAGWRNLARVVDDFAEEVYLYDTDSYQVMNANHALCKNLGYSTEDFQHLKHWDYMEELTQEALEELIAPLHALACLMFSSLARSTEKRTAPTIQLLSSCYPVAIRLLLLAIHNPPLITAIAQDMTGR